jgi:hypothetical protein
VLRTSLVVGAEGVGLVTTTTNRWNRWRALRALAEVLGSPGRVGGFLVSASVVTFFYTLLLPFDYTQRFELANWDYLHASLLTWAILLGLAMGLVLSVQVHAMRKVAAARAATGAAGGVAFVVSLLPSFLCCTPIVPSILAFVGVSGAGLYTTTGALQHFFAVHQTEFLAASLALLGLMCWWGLRKVAAAECFTEDGCVVEAASGEGAAMAPGGGCGDAQVVGRRRTPADAAGAANDAIGDRSGGATAGAVGEAIGGGTEGAVGEAIGGGTEGAVGEAIGGGTAGAAGDGTGGGAVVQALGVREGALR